MSSPTRNNNPRRLYSRIGSVEESAAPIIANETNAITETNETTSIIDSSSTNYSNLHSSNSHSYTMDEGNTRKNLNAPLSRDEDVSLRNNNDTDEETAAVMEVALSPSLSSTGSSNSSNHNNYATKGRFLSLRSSRSNDNGSHENLISNNNGDEEEGRTSKSSSSFIPPIIASNSSTFNTNTIPDEYKLNVTILDSTQKKFQLIANSQWTTSQLKECGYKIHNVPPFQQRLICMGKLLQDDKRLEEQGLVVNNNNNDSNNSGTGSVGNGNSVIVHLFPKPNVVIANDNHNDDNCENNASTNETNSNNNNNNNNSSSGAHVPQIILNRDEVSRVGQILVLSSHEAYETLHRVRLLSFLLLAYCTLQILRDVTIYLAPPEGSTSGMNSGYYFPSDDDFGGGNGSGSGSSGHGAYIPPGDPIDTTSNSPYNDQDTLPQWEDKDYVELIISCFGVYVALLGMKATTDHVGYLAKRFLILLGLLGISWTVFTFYGHFIYNLALEKALSGGNGNDEEGGGGGSSSTGTSSSTTSNVETTMALKVSFMETMVPIFIWLIFYIRAAQFHAMIREAEMEANQRVMNLIPSRSNDSDVSASSSNGGGGDLELQVEHGTMA